MNNIRNSFVVISVILFISISSSADGNANREQRPAPEQEIRISEMGIRRQIVECIKDHKRLDSAAECDEWPLQAWLDEENETIVLNDQERRRLITILKEYKERPHFRSSPRPSREEMSDPEKTEAHMQRRKIFLGKARRFPDFRIDRLLALFGEQETIDALVNIISDENYRPTTSPVSSPEIMLGKSKQPAVITALSSVLFINEDTAYSFDGRISYSPRSVNAMYIIIYILRESDQFPDEVREWAGSLFPPDFSTSQRRELVRAWWKVNQEAMLAGNYMKTRPLTEDEHKQINKDD